MADATNPSGRMARFWRDQEIETLEQESLEAVCFATDDMTVGWLIYGPNETTNNAQAVHDIAARYGVGHSVARAELCPTI